MSSGYGYHQQQQNLNQTGNAAVPVHNSNGSVAPNGNYAQFYHQRQQAYQQQWAAYYNQQQRTADFQARMQSSYKQVHPIPPNLQAQAQQYSYASAAAGAPRAAYPPNFPTGASYANSAYGTHQAYGTVPRVPNPVAQQPAQQAARNQAKKPSGFPDSLQMYVQAALRSCISDKAKKTRVEAMLKVIVEKSIAKNTLWSTDWSKAPAVEVLYNSLIGGKGTNQTGKLESRAAAAAASDARDSRSTRATYEGSSSASSQQTPFTHPSYAAHAATSSPQRLSNNPNYVYSQSNKAKTKETRRDVDKAKRKKQQKGKKAKKSKTDVSLLPSGEDRSKLNMRQARFSEKNAPKLNEKVRWNPYQAQIDKAKIKTAMNAAEQYGESIDLSKFAIKGTSTALEKPYLRLTSAPDPSTVRPEPKLIESLKWVKKRWRKRKKYSYEAERERKTPYVWASEQLKSIRQDLTVQHIRNNFTVNVYETHARMALEQEDLTEFNQCQTKLVELYKCQLGDAERQNEFAAYRIFYQVYIRFKYSSPSSEMTSLLQSLTPDQRGSKVVKHALRVRSAIETSNYAAFFQLYEAVENMGVYLLDLLVDYVRHEALKVVCRAYRPRIPLTYVMKLLLLQESSKEWQDLVENDRVKLVDEGGNSVEVVKAAGVFLDTKCSMAYFNTSFKWRVLKGDNVQRSEN